MDQATDMKDLPLEERRRNFLVHWIAKIEGLKDYQLNFFEACIEHILAYGELTTSELRELDDRIESKRVQARSYSSWLKNLCKELESSKSRVSNELAEFGLDRLPILKIENNIGQSQQNCFRIDIESGDFSNESNAYSDTTASEQHTPSHEDLDHVQYYTKEIKRVPWWINVAAPFFESYRKRIYLLITCLSLFVPGVFICWKIFSWSVGMLAQEGITGIPAGFLSGAILIFPVALFVVPIKLTLEIATNKIAMIDGLVGITLPYGTVCISEIVHQNPNNLKDVTRRLNATCIEADCPICLKKWNIRGTVYLTKSNHFLGGKIIGECGNNPKQHRYEFDKDLMIGKRI